MVRKESVFLMEVNIMCNFLKLYNALPWDFLALTCLNLVRVLVMG